MKNALITGANRGIGLEICRQLKEKDYEIHAVCRQTSDALNEIATQVYQGIDVGTIECIKKLKDIVNIEHLDLIVNVAGVLGNVSLDHLDFVLIEKQFQVNTLGPLRIVKALEDKIVNGGKIAMITSRMGSIADNTSGGYYGYRMSKAALNMASKSLAMDLKAKNIAIGIIHPGYVKTRMTEMCGHITPSQSAEGIIARIEELTLKNSGTFFHQNGEELPW